MSSTLTARTELVPVRQPHAVPPSVMPLLRATASPNPATLLKEASNALDATAASKLDAAAAVKHRGAADSQGQGVAVAGTADARTVLGRVNVNVNVASGAASLLQKRALGRGGAAPQLTIAKSIPRPAAAPDVFAPEPSRANATGTSAPHTATSLLGKRARDATPTAAATLAKRQRAEATALAAKSHREEQDRWLQKWQKVFPTLVFHFEIGVEEGAGRGLRNRVLNMGAKIDQFFSQRVSHLIVKGSGTPQKAKPTRKGTYTGAASDNPFLDKTGTTDLVDKAKALNIKVWTVKKLSDMVNKLAPLDNATGDSLSHLLADEKVNGTRERDLSAPRPDYYYFKPGNRFLLVEDATGRNRPIMVKEYNAKERAWPVLHEHFLRLTSSSQLPASVQNSHNLFKDLRDRAVALYVDQRAYRGELPPAPELKPRSKGDEIPLTPAIPDSLPYVKASGNSVVITSAIASTSTANLTPNAFANGVPQLGSNKDRAIMQMSKRVQVLKGNARMAATVSAKKTAGSENSAPESTPSSGHVARRRSTGFDAPTTIAKEFLTQSQVIAMLHQLRGPTNVAKPTFEERAKNREEVSAGYKRKDQDTASGYCENCRVRYTDLSVHIASRKHRRFATTAKNFSDLDIMLDCVQRPPNPLICLPTRVCRPCTKEHHQDAECGRCRDNPELFSSPPPSSTMGSSPASARTYRRGGAYDDGSDHEMGDEERGGGLEAIDEEESINGEGEDEDEQWEEGDRPLEQ